jgi:hypothetical protein
VEWGKVHPDQFETEGMEDTDDLKKDFLPGKLNNCQQNEEPCCKGVGQEQKLLLD